MQSRIPFRAPYTPHRITDPTYLRERLTPAQLRAWARSAIDQLARDRAEERARLEERQAAARRSLRCGPCAGTGQVARLDSMRTATFRAPTLVAVRCPACGGTGGGERG